MTTMNQTHATDDRWQTIHKLWQENQWLYVLIGIFIGIIFSQLVTVDITEFTQSLMPEAIGIGFTVLILDRIYQGRERNRYKEQLIREMGSEVSSVSLRAVEELRSHKWHNDGSLHGVNIWSANLENAKLDHWDMAGVQFMLANLKNARFNDSDLSEVVLFRGSYGIRQKIPQVS